MCEWQGRDLFASCRSLEVAELAQVGTYLTLELYHMIGQTTQLWKVPIITRLIEINAKREVCQCHAS